MYDRRTARAPSSFAAKYKANQILAGWEEALETMREGGTRVLGVPGLAYGDKGVCLENGECLVQPGERLRFELTLKRVAMPPATTGTSRGVSTRSTGVVVHVTRAWPRIGVCGNSRIYWNVARQRTSSLAKSRRRWRRLGEFCGFLRLNNLVGLPNVGLMRPLALRVGRAPALAVLRQLLLLLEAAARWCCAASVSGRAFSSWR